MLTIETLLFCALRFMAVKVHLCVAIHARKVK